MVDKHYALVRITTKMEKSIAYFLLAINVLTIGHVHASGEQRIEEPIRLTPANYKALMSAEDPLIIDVTQGLKYDHSTELASVATSLLGVANVAYLDLKDQTNEDIAKELGVKHPETIVFSYGSKEARRRQTVVDLEDAKKLAMNSYPDQLTPIQEEVILPFFLKATKENRPPRFPVIYFTNEEEVPPSLKCASVLFREEFSFAKLVQPGKHLLSNFSVSKVPSLVTILKLSPKTGAFELVAYNEKAFGRLKFKNLVKYLYGIHTKFSLKDNAKEQDDEETLQIAQEDDSEEDKDEDDDKAEKEERSVSQHPVILEATSLSFKRFCYEEMAAACAIAVIGGKTTEEVKKTQNILDNIRKSETLRDHHIRYFWINATCHEDYLESFANTKAEMPSFVVVQPQGLVYAAMTTKFSYSQSRKFLLAFLAQKAKTRKLKVFPIPEYRRCKDHLKKQKTRKRGKNSKPGKRARSAKLSRVKTEL